MRLSPTARHTGSPRLVDMFSGAGIFASGFVKEGFVLVQAAEIEKAACRTHAKNHGEVVRCEDVACSASIAQADVLIAGPPCQGFSTLGKRDALDPRNALCLEILRWVEQSRPQLVIVENVPAFLHSAQCAQLIEGLRQRGFGYVQTSTLVATHFGVAQARTRGFLVASTGAGFEFPKFTAASPPSVRDVFSGLSAVPDGRNLHLAHVPSALARQRMSRIPSRGDKRDLMRLAPELCPPSWWRVKSEVTDVWGRMDWDQPSNTLRTCFLNPSKGRYIHPEQDRVISLREGARIQGIPDEWEFVGTPYQVARQIGNSVPFPVARALAKSALATLV